MHKLSRMSLLIAALLIAACLAGCGQKGELYLEPEDAAASGEAQQEDGDDGNEADDDED